MACAEVSYVLLSEVLGDKGWQRGVILIFGLVVCQNHKRQNNIIAKKGK